MIQILIDQFKSEINMTFRCDYCKREKGSTDLLTDMEMQTRSKRAVGKYIKGIGDICFDCIKNNRDVPEIEQSFLDSSQTVYAFSNNR